jgi:tetratricopeptide (TPR) repeat protein
MVHPLRRLVLLSCLVWGAMAGAQADVLRDVEVLYRSGEVETALSRADAAIAANPADARMRFFKGVMLAESGRAAEAQAVFERLNQEFPELPEPYNNLAVLHAARGDWQLARQALEAALRADPGYTIAYENLGDVYLQLARVAYERASGHRGSAVDRKLSMVRELLASRLPTQSIP